MLSFIPDPTMMDKNTIEVLEKVEVNRRKQWFMQAIVPVPELEEIFQTEYSNEERIFAYAHFYANCHPQSSWIHLCKML